jgi:hypothetical protein
MDKMAMIRVMSDENATQDGQSAAAVMNDMGAVVEDLAEYILGPVFS